MKELERPCRRLRDRRGWSGLEVRSYLQELQGTTEQIGLTLKIGTD